MVFAFVYRGLYAYGRKPPRPPDPEGNPLCRASVPFSDLRAFFENALTDLNIADIISSGVSERSADTNVPTNAMSNVVPVFDSSMVSRKNKSKKNKSSPYSRLRSLPYVNSNINNGSAALNISKGVTIFQSHSLESFYTKDICSGHLLIKSSHASSLSADPSSNLCYISR